VPCGQAEASHRSFRVKLKQLPQAATNGTGLEELKENTILECKTDSNLHSWTLALHRP
jgi:hypothetical protein